MGSLRPRPPSHSKPPKAARALPPLPAQGPKPVKAPAPPPVKARLPTPVSTADKKGARSVLVVEDDEAIRRLLVRALRTAYTVYEAGDGEAAAQLLDAHPSIDCVVSDVFMPRMSGTDLAKKMRTDPRFKNMPVLFVTAKPDAVEAAEGVRKGNRYYLRKPFKLKELIDKVESLFVGAPG